ncbi:T9SS type A sorting domain-containing protein [Kaistella flava (ex Peng et al. 2021)]|uniref:T9SS type A sorting domain-containing protein n=1 Tax=Kaistella flava (ex Peng et al. 2021) TaxID=2038776 RepID=A0A7M2Y8J3_9FLAO|nr:fibronectin type III domain-containing protein [Kaistella flava (ex Peng et al. 2021)]QOW10577.1 T9SS type A sorting domain-containing protein [Kaistella flava (ex Peng et al. 2021)]
MQSFLSSFKTMIFSFLFLFIATAGWGQTTVTYTFGSKSWTATPATWTSGKDGNGFTAGQGIQITAAASGAYGNSPVSFSNISKVVVNYATNASTGVGTITPYAVSGTSAAAMSGTAIAATQSVSTTGGATPRTMTFTPASAITGYLQIYTTCNTNSIYIYSVDITYGTPTGPTVTTTAASGISTAGATLNGSINANGISTSASFDYGKTVGYGSTLTASPATITGTTITAISGVLTGLDVNTQYNYRAVGTVSSTATNGSNLTFWTFANVANAPIVDSPTVTSLNVAIATGDGNPAATTYAIQETNSSKYVQTNGSLGATAVYQTAATWGTKSVTGLANGTAYTFKVIARNGANVDASSSTGTTGTTTVLRTATLSGSLSEANLNGATFTIALTNDTFNATGSLSGFTLNNAPSGATISSVVATTSTAATVTLAYDDTDFDTTINNFSITIPSAVLTSNVSLTSGVLSITAVTETLSVSAITAFGSKCLNSETINTFTISGTNLKAGNISLAPLAGFTYSSDNSTYSSTLSIAVAAGNLAAKTVYVKFIPTIAQSYNGNIVVSGVGAPSTNRSVTGTGINTAPTVTTPTSTAITATTATLGGNITVAGCSPITERGIYYSTTPGFANGTGTKVSDTGTSLSLGLFTVNVSGLTSNTTYYYKAFAMSASGTAYSTQESFTTSCTAISSFPFTESFEGISTGVPACWGLAGTTTTSGYNFSSFVTGQTGKGLRFDSYVNQSGRTGELTTPPLDLSSLTSAELKFYFKNPTGGNFEVLISTNGGSTYTSLENGLTAQTDWLQKTYDITNYISSNVKIKFLATSNYGNGDAYIYLDEINVQAGATCVVPSALTSTAITASTVSLNWSASPSNPSGGYDYYYSTTNTAPAGATTPSGNVGAGITTANITGLSSNTTYYYWVRSNCGGGDKSLWVAGASFTTAIIAAPVATAATEITPTGFKANWEAVAGATGYELDLYTKEVAGGELFNEGFTWPDNNGTGGNSGGWSGNIASTTTNLSTYLASWTYSSAYKADYCMKLGTASLQGSLTTPALNFVGNGTLTFRAGAWDGTSEQTVLKLEISGGGSLSVSEVTMIKGSFTTYTVEIAGATALTKITFKGYQASNSRFFLDDVKVMGDIVTYTSVAGYPDLSLSGTLKAITGLNPNTQYYYRVRAKDAHSTSVNSNVIEVATLGGVTTWYGTSWSNGIPKANMEAIIDGPYDMATDSSLPSITAYNLTVNNKLVVKAGEFVKITNELSGNSSGNITVESDANFVQTALSSTNNYNGTFKVNRDVTIKRLDYVFWSSPVTGQNLKAFSPGTVFNRFMTYNESTDKFDPIFSGATDGTMETTNFKPGKGYAIRAKNTQPTPAENWPGIFAGAPNNGSVEFNLENNGEGFNLVGNPYPSNIDFNALVDTGAIEGTAWFWTNINGYSNGDYDGDNYAILTSASGGTPASNKDVESSTPTLSIKVGQGFIVQAKKAGPLTFSNAMRNDGTDESEFINRGTSKDPIDRFWLKLTTPAQNFNTILIAYPKGATNGFESSADAQQFGESSDAFYSVLNDYKLNIQGRQFPLLTSDIVSLGMKGFESGNYKISMVQKEGVFANGQNIYLKDNQTGTFTNLSENSYAFTANAGLTEGRFEIVYEDQVVLGTDAATKDALVVYRDGNDFVVKSTTKPISEIEVYDTSGRLLLKVKANHKEARIDAGNFANGIYVLKITSASLNDQKGSVITRKIMK